MSAPVRIDLDAFSDPRIEALGVAAGYNRYEALGRLAYLWGYCTKRQTRVVDEMIVEGALACSADVFVRCGLGERAEDGIRVRGLDGRIEWYASKVSAARSGGEANKARLARLKAEKPNGSLVANSNEPIEAEPKPDGSRTEATPNPNGSPLSLSLSLSPRSEDLDQTPIVPTGDFSGSIPNRPKPGRPKKPKPSEPTDAERASARVILDKLGKQNGVRYSGTEHHVRLIARQLRNGFDEMDLRYVVLHCAEGLDWKTDPKLRPYLRPETLFGPETISKYIDAARTLRAEREADERARAAFVPFDPGPWEHS